MPEKPEWLRKRLPTGKLAQEIEADLMKGGLHTICQEGCCPNQGECFSRGVATFLIMGNVCTRNCRFCAVTTGKPTPLDGEEPAKLAEEIHKMKLRFVVITSVTRDDLPDGGADHFVEVIQAVRQTCPGVGIEVLIPDFQGSTSALEAVIKSKPEVLNHNVETVPRLFRHVRPMGDYEQSVTLLKKAKEIDQSMITKSGFMVGLGETLEDIENVMNDLRKADCDILTIGQYLRPSKKHYPVYEYVDRDVYNAYKKLAYEKGFKHVAAGPFVRSSYRAEESYKKALNFEKEKGGMA
jgi:lipoic acid synthetase